MLKVEVQKMIMGGGMWIGLILLVLLIFLVGGGIAATVWFLGQSSKQEPRRESDALEILRQRYARGEIDREEFEQMREELES